MPILHADIPVGAATWVPISNGAVATFLRVQNVGGYVVEVQATAANAAPTGAGGALRLSSNLEGDIIDVASRFPGVGAPAFFWARSKGEAVTLSVSHA